MSRPRATNEVSTKLQRIAELAKQDTEVKFTSLAHLLTPGFLKESFLQLNQKATPGSDGVTMHEFRNNLDESIETLWTELMRGTYRAQPVRRVYIPKGNGKKRPLGIPSVRDRTVQRAVKRILEVIYEPYFCEFSHGFRPGRSCHDALESLRKTIDRKPIRYVVDADIKGYFDNVNHRWMKEFLRHRVKDRTLLRLIAKWLKAGVMENGVVCRSEDGTPQGGPLSPLLANIYLHYVLDLWFEKRIKPRMRGECTLVRYADDFLVCFELRDEAAKFLKELQERFARFNLELSAEKTQLIEFGKDSDHNNQIGPSNTQRTFDFLGFTHYMRKKGKRGYKVARKPCRKSRNKFLKNAKIWLEKYRHIPVWIQAKRLKRMLHGYYNYFGLRYCKPALRHIKWHLERIWISVLRRRGQKHRLYWKDMDRYGWFRSLPKPKLR